ncbi:MAG: hypothetical protein F4X64_06375 [Chloroflexi bacterium]|nr:hypothetical protein [Chloroflexota bacterium]
MIIPRPGPSDSLLVVEGKTDLHVVRHLSERSDPSLAFGIQDYEGIDNVLGSIHGHIDTPDRPAVGFVMDSDDNVRQTWLRVRGEFSRAARPIRLPDSPDPNGTIIAGDPGVGGPRIGIWLMPNNSADGELENFVADMIPTNDPVWPLSQQYIDGIPTSHRKFAPGKTIRAQVHAWLATLADPRLMGQAIGFGDLSITGQLTQTFLRWLSRLFR